MKVPSFSRSFLLIVMIPGVLGAAYFAAISDNLYDSQAIVALKSVAGDSRALTSLMGGSSSTGTDSANLRQLMLSHDMMNHVDAKVGLTRVWSAPSLDIIGRLWPPHPSRERLMRYYLWRVTVDFDNTTDMITIRATSFEPRHAQEIAQELVTEANRYTNDVSAGLAQMQQESMEKQTQLFYDRLVTARDKLVAFQTANGILDAEGTAKAEATLVSKLQGEEAGTSAELTQALTYLSPEAFGAQALRQKLSALHAELARQQAIAVTPGTTGTKALEYRALKTDADFLEQGYLRSQTALEQASLDATRDAKKLVIIQSANLPDEPRFLARLTGFGIWLLILVAIFTVTRLTIAVYRERTLR